MNHHLYCNYSATDSTGIQSIPYSYPSPLTRRCPVCNTVLIIPLKCDSCNRELINSTYIDNYTNEVIMRLKNPITWLDSFENIEVYNVFYTTPFTPLSGSIIANRLQVSTINFPVVAYHILLAWKRRDKSRRYMINRGCISKLLKLNFKEIEKAYIISTL